MFDFLNLSERNRERKKKVYYPLMLLHSLQYGHAVTVPFC